MYEVTGTKLKLSNFNFFDWDKSGEPDCFLFKESDIPAVTDVGVADLELCALFDFLLSFSLTVSDSEPESLEKSLDESFPEVIFLRSFFLDCFFFFFLSFFLSTSLVDLSLS